MEDKNYLHDIREIREMMDRSTQFISLSGLSGVLAGIYALSGAFVANKLLENYRQHNSIPYHLSENIFNQVVITAAVVLFLSIGTALLLTSVKAKKTGESVWNSTSKRLIANFLIPLCTGGIFTILLLKESHYDLIAPATLIFYGLACVNASKYTFRDVRYLGLTIIILGLISTEFFGYALEFWALGFGVCHIIYGGIMHYKYDRPQ